MHFSGVINSVEKRVSCLNEEYLSICFNEKSLGNVQLQAWINDMNKAHLISQLGIEENDLKEFDDDNLVGKSMKCDIHVKCGFYSILSLEILGDKKI